MADFEKFFARLMIHEGGLSNNEFDKGGLTYKGIARNMDKHWVGWPKIESYRTHAEFPDILEQDDELQRMVKDYYREAYWGKYDLDSASDVLAWEIFDICVNMGHGRTVRFMQQIFNSLNNNGTRWNNIAVDGGLGPITRSTWKKFKDECHNRNFDPDIVLARLLNLKQGAFYFTIMENNETQEEFAWGWFGRVISFT
ncbi:MAG: hypothetical protein D6E12_03630 [Desulfovibrio sp.]|nr:MAG: hypothetical protein D6E12_03630 [Desulfovibrio sp.]